MNVARSRYTRVLVGSLAAALAVAGSARAQPSGDTAAAEALFREGKRLMHDERWPDACPKLAESQRIDPATGTLLALALCYEGWGKTASAWATYADAATRSSREGRADREQAARERVRALEPRLARLSIVVAPSVGKAAGLAVERDGVAVGAAAFGVAVPVDPGEHTVVARATGKKPRTFTVTVVAQGATQTVTVDALVDEPRPPAGAAPRTPAGGGPTPLQIGGLVAGGAGVVGLGVGTFFGVRAMGKDGDSEADCTGNVCGKTGAADRRDALAAGDVATAAFVVGGVLVAGGAAAFFLGRPSDEGSVRGARARPLAVAAPLVLRDGAGVVVRGSLF